MVHNRIKALALVCAAGMTAYSGIYSGILNVHAADPVLDNGLCYAVHEDHVEITGYDMPADTVSVEIPSEIEGLPVTVIGQQAFFSAKSLVSISIPETVETIGIGAFYRCSGLTEIIIPDSVTTIEESAFIYCSSLENVKMSENVTVLNDHLFFQCNALASVSLPDGITDIGEHAFASCWNLQELELPQSLESIGDFAFAACKSLKTLTFAENLSTIGEQAFMGCQALESFAMEEGNAAFSVQDGVLFDLEGTELVRYPAAKADAEYIIPDGVTSLRESAFDHCANLKHLTTGESLTVIPWLCFQYSSSLEEVDLSASVREVDYYAFMLCDNLRSVEFGDDLKTVRSYAFYGTALSDVYYEGSADAWQYVTVMEQNDALLNASLHCSGSLPAKGDLDGDAVTSITDVIWLSKALMGADSLTVDQSIAADVDGDGMPTSKDALRMMQFIVKLIDEL